MESVRHLLRVRRAKRSAFCVHSAAIARDSCDIAVLL